MKIKKFFAVVLSAAMAVGVLAGCNGGENKASDGNVTISVGDWPTKEGSQLERRTEQKASFEEKFNNVSIEPDTWSFDLRTFYPKAEAGLLPNVFRTHYTEAQKLIDGEYTYDITDILKEKGLYENMNPQLLEMISKDGRVMMMPTEAYSIGLVYNVDLYEKAGLMEKDGTPKQPKDWNEMAEFAVKIKEATGKAGFVLTTSNNTGGWLFTNIAWSFGVDFMEQDKDGKWKATFNTKEAVEALQFIKDLRWKYDVLPAGALVDQKEQIKLYATGEAGMALAAGSSSASVAPYEMDVNHFGIMAIPSGPVRRVSLIGGTVNCISENSTPEQAVAGIDWLIHIGTDYRATDALRQSRETFYQQKVENGEPIGVKSFSIWNDSSEVFALNDEMIEKYGNINQNHVRLYNESLVNGKVELQAEEPVCAQDLYSILDSLIQNVLNDKDADCEKLIEKANNDFQTNYLNNLDY